MPIDVRAMFHRGKGEPDRPQDEREEIVIIEGTATEIPHVKRCKKCSAELPGSWTGKRCDACAAEHKQKAEAIVAAAGAGVAAAAPAIVKYGPKVAKTALNVVKRVL
ncbi:MAG: hypothetical protein UHD09_06200 [Bifidobacterium sp.]|nr:hypothetical protein [Bifidobacterium sp.]